MSITMIAACAKNRTIGNNNQLLWHLPKDFAWFKEKTLGHDVVMGRNTMQSICTFTKGKPLPGRHNIVLSTTMKSTGNGSVPLEHFCESTPQEAFTIYHRAEDILELAQKKEVMIIGGEKIYQFFIPYARKLILTEIDKDFRGDAYFPIFQPDDYQITFEEQQHEKGLDYRFVIYER